jgi:hypothetical protein
MGGDMSKKEQFGRTLTKGMSEREIDALAERWAKLDPDDPASGVRLVKELERFPIILRHSLQRRSSWYTLRV